MANKVCDFCLSDAKGLFGRHEKLADGHYICKNCKSIIKSYGLPVKYDLFQTLVTAQKNMTDMIMDAWLENHDANDAVARYYPLPSILLHDGEHCLSGIKATYYVANEQIPQELAVTSIADIKKGAIHNVPTCEDKSKAVKVEGMLYETEAALYFLSEHIINVHRLGYMKRNTKDTEHITVATPSRTFVYTVEHADLFFLRERFFQKVRAAQSNKQQHLIYISDDNQLTITPGIYDIPRSLRPGTYKVTAINDAGLHMRDPLGRVKDYYANEEEIEIHAGGTLECTGEYKLQWVEKKKK